MRAWHKDRGSSKRKISGATLVEFVIIAPILLFSLLGLMQTGLVFHAKSNVNYAAFEAARAGTTGNAQLPVIRNAFVTAMTGYYGGGRNASEIATSLGLAQADVTPAALRIELLSPSVGSFDDYASPRLSKVHNTGARVIPNSNLNAINCPIDSPCNSNPSSNASGQTLSDANILKLRITYGIPSAKQMPLVGRFYVTVLRGLRGVKGEVSPLLGLNNAHRAPINQDAFINGLLAQNRIPVVTHIAMRMQSDAIENGNAVGGTGNHGTPTDPGTVDPVYPGGGHDDGGSNGDPDDGETDPGNGGNDVSCGGENAEEPNYTPVPGMSFPGVGGGGSSQSSKLPGIYLP